MVYDPKGPIMLRTIQKETPLNLCAGHAVFQVVSESPGFCLHCARVFGISLGADRTREPCEPFLRKPSPKA